MDEINSCGSEADGLGELLAVGLEAGKGLIDLLGVEFAQVDSLLHSVAEGGDGGGAAIFAFTDNDAGGTGADGFVVGGDVFAEGFGVGAGLAQDEPELAHALEESESHSINIMRSNHHSFT
jgi:hypothetical protein